MNTVTQETPIETSRELALELHRTMARVRAFEERLHRLVADREVEGFVHLTVGQEGVDVGVCSLLRADDAVFTSFRNHGQCIAKGMEMRPMMAEMFGRATGCNRGKGGSMHLADHDRWVFGGNGLVGSAPPLALGPALSARTLGEGRVAVCFFGEGAAQQGVVHESMNLASIWRLPVVFVCANNNYAQSTPLHFNSSVRDIAARAAAYDMPGEIVDGQDVLAVRSAAERAIERARAGEGPTLLEAKTFLYHGAWEGEHPLSMSYRDRELEAHFLARDPVGLLADRVVQEGWATRAEIERTLSAAEDEVTDAVDYARSSPWPEPAELASDVYAVG